MENKRLNLLDLPYDQLKELVISSGAPTYRADQLWRWIYQKLASSYSEMSDLPLSWREKLAEETTLFTLIPLEKKVSVDGLTQKILFQLADGKTIESTLMSYDRSESNRERRTVCISTQVGCALGCTFCATGQQGFERNLRTGEILEQVLFLAHLEKEEKMQQEANFTRRPVTNVVFMGMGEPLANYENVWQAIKILNAKTAMELGARQITISTAGFVPQIRRLAGERLHVELAVSLHAPNDQLRERLMPVNKKYPLLELIPACRDYFTKTSRRPTFEYALFQDINDSLDNASALAQLLNGLNCSVNLIAGNPTVCRDFRSSGLKQAAAFQARLTARGIVSTIRASRGIDIEAGCGQLRSRLVFGPSQ